MNNNTKSEQDLAMENLMKAMKAYENNSDLQEQEATALSNSLNVDREKILKVLKVAVKQ